MINRTGYIEIYTKWMLLISSLFLFAPNNLSLQHSLVFISLIALLYYPLFILKDKKKFSVKVNLPKKINSWGLFLLILIEFALADYAARFYTGSGLLDAISALKAGESNYYLYQSHFAENNLSGLTLKKVPAILAAAAVKGIYLFVISIFFLYRNNQKPKYFLLLCIIPLILFSVARGTFFEVFEISLSIFYFHKITSSKAAPSLNVRIRNNVYLVTTFVILTFLFSLNAASRYEDKSSFLEKTCSLGDFCFSPYTNFTTLEHSIYFLSSYFSTGLYFITQYILLLFEGKLLSSLLPFTTLSIFSTKEIGLTEDLCANYINCGVAWQPDLFYWFSFFGFILCLFIFPVFFYYLIKLERVLLRNLNLYSLPLSYLLLIYLVSIPVGNFFTTSSSSYICAIAFTLLWLIKRKIKR